MDSESAQVCADNENIYLAGLVGAKVTVTLEIETTLPDCASRESPCQIPPLPTAHSFNTVFAPQFHRHRL